MSSLPRLGALLLALTARSFAQLGEDFDRASPPALPAGWSSSSGRAVSDFVTTTSLPASPPNCALATNATVAQSLTSPAFDVRGLVLEALVFQSRRSSTFGAALLVEASTDGGESFPVLLGDTLRSGPSPGSYVLHRLEMATVMAESLRLRWRVIASASGSTGTLRIDDVRLEVRALQDLALCALRFAPSLPGEPLEASLRIANTGLLQLGLCEAAIAVDADGDSLFAPQERFARIVVPPAPGESLWIAMDAGRSPSRTSMAMAEVRREGDRFEENNTLWSFFRPAVAPGSVVFNEIMFAPLAGQPEYLELAVSPGLDRSLSGWMLEWGPPGSGPAGSYFFPDSVGEDVRFVVVASSEPGVPGLARERAELFVVSSLSLRNDGGVLILRDFRTMTNDSLQYAPSWHTPSVVETRGRSLEKILPDLGSADGRNWATCTDPAGGTPGQTNSLSVATVKSRAMIACSPNPFSPDGDGRDDWTVVRYEFPRPAHAVDLTVHDARGRVVRHLATRELGGRRGTVVWDGRNDERETVRMGIYVVVIQGTDAQGEALPVVRAAVVVGRPLR